MRVSSLTCFRQMKLASSFRDAMLSKEAEGQNLHHGNAKTYHGNTEKMSKFYFVSVAVLKTA